MIAVPPPPLLAQSAAKPWLFRALAVLLTLLAMEGIARHYVAGQVDYLRRSPDPALLYESRPGAYRSDGSLLRIPPYPVFIDAAGCRIPGPDPAPPGPSADADAAGRETRPDVSEMLFLGDSFTFGQGVPFSQTFVAQTARLLQAEGRPLRARNCAVDGYNLTQIARRAEVLLPALSPPWVVIPFFSNDLQAPLKLQETLPPSPALAWVVARSRLLRSALLLRATVRGAMDPEPLTPAEIEGALDRIVAALEGAGSRGIFLCLSRPTHPSVDLDAALKARDIPLYVAPERFAAQWVIPHNGHWNEAGHGEIARWLAPLLAELLEEAAADGVAGGPDPGAPQVGGLRPAAPLAH